MKMKKTFFAVLVLMALTACKNNVKETAEMIDLPRAETPDNMAKAMDGFFEQAAADSMDIHSVMIVRDGNVIYSRWQSEGVDTVPHVLHSVSKTFTATAVGLAIADGKLALTDKVIDFFPDKLPADISDNLKAMTVRDLLTMTCGHDEEPTGQREEGADWVQAFLAHPVIHEPGTFYLYNSLGTYMCSAIVQKVTGEKVVDYLDARLFQPLHIDKPKWEESPQGINCGGWGLYLKTEDLAKMGQLLLQNGEWNGQQLIPAEWVAEMSREYQSWHAHGGCCSQGNDQRNQRLDARLRLPDVALPPRLLPCRWCPWSVHHRRARQESCHRYHFRQRRFAGRVEPRVGAHSTGAVIRPIQMTTAVPLVATISIEPLAPTVS